MYLMLSYFGSGFLMALPLGPVGVKVLSTLAVYGKRSSRYAFAGMITGELFFVLLAIGFYQWQATMFPSAVVYLYLISAMTMILFGGHLCRNTAAPPTVAFSSVPSVAPVGNNVRFFRHTFLITIANPMILLIYLSAWTSMQTHFQGQLTPALLAMFLFIAGGALWPQLLIRLLATRQQLLVKSYWLASWITGISLISYGVYLLWSKVV